MWQLGKLPKPSQCVGSRSTRHIAVHGNYYHSVSSDKFSVSIICYCELMSRCQVLYTSSKILYFIFSWVFRKLQYSVCSCKCCVHSCCVCSCKCCVRSSPVHLCNGLCVLCAQVQLSEKLLISAAVLFVCAVAAE